MPTTTIKARGILFDLDGTLISSTPVCEAVWHKWVKEYPYVDLREVFKKKFESDVLKEAERIASSGGDGIRLLPGVQKLLVGLNDVSKDTSRWAIVTSATNAYATTAITTVDLPKTSHLITADEVTRGIVFEDAPSGVKAGVASGALVVAVCTSHNRKALEGLGAHHIVEDLSLICLDTEGDEVTIAFPC
ncbi:hypothetical protein L204_104523 [Cryptococcus depauperatus]